MAFYTEATIIELSILFASIVLIVIFYKFLFALSKKIIWHTLELLIKFIEKIEGKEERSRKEKIQIHLDNEAQ